jgi:hypothetical protein
VRVLAALTVVIAHGESLVESSAIC